MKKPTHSPEQKYTSGVGVLLDFEDVKVLDVLRTKAEKVIVITSILNDSHKQCPTCGAMGKRHGTRRVDLIDLPFHNKPVIIRWKKQRMRCTNGECKLTWTIQDPRIASARSRLTTIAAKWCVEQLIEGDTIARLAKTLHCDWHTVDHAISLYGNALLEADTERIRHTKAIGLDETAFLSHRGNNYQGTHYVTTICDTVNNTVVDIAPSRKKDDVVDMLKSFPEEWLEGIKFGTLDLSPTYRAVYALALPGVIRIADPFHVIKLANLRLDEIRRRIQWETTGHRGRKDDPLYTIRRRLLTGLEKLSEKSLARVESALKLGDPDGTLCMSWRVKETLRESYKKGSPEEAKQSLQAVIDNCLRKESPKELKQLGRTLTHWWDEIVAYFTHRFSNGPTEGINNRIKKIKRDGYGFRNFENYRLRILLRLGGVNTRLLEGIFVP